MVFLVSSDLGPCAWTHRSGHGEALFERKAMELKIVGEEVVSRLRGAVEVIRDGVPERSAEGPESPGDVPVSRLASYKIASVGPPSPKMPAPYPSWKTNTTTPNAPATERRFMKMALRGTSTDWKAMNNMTKVVATTRITTNGN